MEMDRNMVESIRYEIERLKRENATMRQEIEQKILKNNIYIVALEKLIEDHNDIGGNDDRE